MQKYNLSKRIVFSKFLNCGQACGATDYTLCHINVTDKLLFYIKRNKKSI